MNPVEMLQTLDTILGHLDRMLSLDDRELHHALQSFSKEFPHESKELLGMLRERKTLEEERLRIFQIKVDFIGEWLKKIRKQPLHDTEEIDQMLRLLNLDPDEIEEIVQQKYKDVS